MLRHIFVQHGRCAPLRRLGDPWPWLQQLPDEARLQELDRQTVVFPRPGDGFYAPPSTLGSDGFPWGQLTAWGDDEMRKVGLTLGTSAAPQQLVVRAVASDASVQSAQAVAVGMCKASGSRHVTEIFLQNHEELSPALSCGELDFPTLGTAATGQANEVVAAIVDLISSCHPGSSTSHHCWEELFTALVCLNDGQQVTDSAFHAIANRAFELWSAPFQIDPSLAAPVLGGLFQSICTSLDEASHSNLSQSDNDEVLLFVMPAEAQIVLAATFGLAPEFGKAGSAARPQGSWPAPGTVLELSAVPDLHTRSLAVRLLYGGVPLAADLPWPALRNRLAMFLQ